MGDGGDIPKSTRFSTLVLQVVDELGVLAVLVGEELLELEHRGVDRLRSVFLEDIGDLVKHPLTDGHGVRSIVLGSLHITCQQRSDTNRLRGKQLEQQVLFDTDTRGAKIAVIRTLGVLRSRAFLPFRFPFPLPLAGLLVAAASPPICSSNWRTLPY